MTPTCQDDQNQSRCTFMYKCGLTVFMEMLHCKFSSASCGRYYQHFCPAKKVQLGDRAIHSGWFQILLTAVKLLCTAYAFKGAGIIICHSISLNEHLPCKSRKIASKGIYSAKGKEPFFKWVPYIFRYVWMIVNYRWLWYQTWIHAHIWTWFYMLGSLIKAFIII